MCVRHQVDKSHFFSVPISFSLSTMICEPQMTKRAVVDELPSFKMSNSEEGKEKRSFPKLFRSQHQLNRWLIFSCSIVKYAPPYLFSA